MKAVTITGTTWLVLRAVFLKFILSKYLDFVLSHVLGGIFVILPIFNHVGIFVAIRRHNKRVVGAVSGPNAASIFKREKRVAIDMIIVIAVLLLCLCPLIAVNTLKSLFPDQ